MHYIYEGNDLIFEKNVDTDEVRYYVYGMGKQLARVDGAIDGEGAFVEGERYFSVTDHLGSVRAVTDEDGNAVWMGGFDAFGNLLTEELLGDGFEPEYVFAGKKLDEDIDMYYFNARWYDARTGRFVTVDPVRDGVNWFVYVANNPLRFVDPTGLFNWETQTVEKGDTLIGITKELNKKAGTDYSYKDLWVLNIDEIEDPNIIEIGQDLIIPEPAWDIINAHKLITDPEVIERNKERRRLVEKWKPSNELEYAAIELYLDDPVEFDRQHGKIGEQLNDELIIPREHLNNQLVGVAEIESGVACWLFGGILVQSGITEGAGLTVPGFYLIADGAYRLSIDQKQFKQKPGVLGDFFLPTIQEDDTVYFFGNGVGGSYTPEEE